MNNVKHINQISFKTRILMKYIQEKPEKNFFRYDEIYAITGIDIRANRSIFYTAIKNLMKEENQVFKCVRGQGYARCGEDAKISKGREGFGKIKRCAKRHTKIISATNLDALDAGKRNEAFLVGSAYNLIKYTLSKPAQRKLAEHVENKCGYIPTKESIKTLKG